MKSKILIFALVLVLILSLCALVSCGACEHEYDELVTVDPTCNAAGTKTLTCKKCGESKEETIPATGEHLWNSGSTTAEPTCGEAGNKKYTCRRCGETKNEPIEATGDHSYVNGDVITPATCVRPGTCKTVCTECGAEGTADLLPTGIHDYQEVEVLTQPTCYQPGSRSMKCKDCEATTISPISATGAHVASTTVMHDDEQHWFACATEGCTEKVNAADHTIEDGETITEAVGCKNGSKHIHCTVCEYESTADILATGAHTFGPFELSADKLTANVACSVCGNMTAFNVKHNFDNEDDRILTFIGSSGGLNVIPTVETEAGNHYQKVSADRALELNTDSQFQVHNAFTADSGLISIRLLGGANVRDFDIISYNVQGDWSGVNGNTTKGCNLLGSRNGVIKTGVAGTSDEEVCTLSDTEWTEITMFFAFDYEAKTITVDYYVNGTYTLTWVGTGLAQTARSSIYLTGHIYEEGAWISLDDFVVAAAN